MPVLLWLLGVPRDCRDRVGVDARHTEQRFQPRFGGAQAADNSAAVASNRVLNLGLE